MFHLVAVNTGDATLIVSPHGRAVLIDVGDRGRGVNPIAEFMDRARADGVITALDFTIATHYDADHIGGMDEVFERGWYPEKHALDRGSHMLPPLDQAYVEESCSHLDAVAAEAIAPWGETAPFVRPTVARRARSSSTSSRLRLATGEEQSRRGRY